MVLGETCETWMSGRLDVDAQSVTPLGSETLLHCAEEIMMRHLNSSSQLLKGFSYIAFALALLACGEERSIIGGEVDVEEYTGDAGPDYIDSGDQVEETQFCASNDDCSFGMACISGQCIDLSVGDGEAIGCEADSDCPSGFACAESSGICMELSPSFRADRRGYVFRWAMA